MSHAKRSSNHKRLKKAVPVLGAAAGLSLSLASGASASPTPHMPTPGAGAGHEIFLELRRKSQTSASRRFMSSIKKTPQHSVPIFSSPEHFGCDRHRRHCPGPEGFSIGSRLRSLDRDRTAARFDWRQTEARADLETRRPISETHFGGRSPCGVGLADAPLASDNDNPAAAPSTGTAFLRRL